MTSKEKTREELLAEVADLQRQLEEMEEVFHAIQTGQVDALVVSRPEGKQIFTLEGAEHAYRVLIETMNEGAATLNEDTTIVYCNKRLAVMLQLPLERVIGSKLADHVAPGDRSLFADRMECRSTCEKEEIALLTSGGDELPVLFSCCAVEISGRQGVSVVITDISSRKQNEKTILRLNRLYAVLSGVNHTIVHTSNRDAILRECCRAAVELGGFRLAWVGLLDKPGGRIKVVAAHGATGFLERTQMTEGLDADDSGPTGRAVRDGTYHLCNDLYSEGHGSRTADAREYGLYASASIAIWQDQQVVGALTLYADESDFFDPQQVELLRQLASDISFALDNIHQARLRREVEHALQKETMERLLAVEELRKNEHLLIQQSRNAAMGEMIGNIAHQWRQPLNNLGLLVQQGPILYELGGVDKEFLENNAKKAMEYIQHMSRTIDDFRNFFKPDKEKVAFKVRDEVAKTLSLMEESFRRLEIATEVHAEGDPVIRGYPNEFSQVLLNILINAKDALVERDIAERRVVICLGEEKGRAVVTIVDNAGGIPEEIIGKIFDPYFTTKGPQAGTGVGLFMSKTIIEKNMAGRLTARNVEGGAEFRIEV